MVVVFDLGSGNAQECQSCFKSRCHVGIEPAHFHGNAEAQPSQRGRRSRTGRNVTDHRKDRHRVLHAARHRACMIERHRVREESFERHGPLCGLQPHDAAGRCRRPDRSTGVAANGGVDQADRDRDSRPIR